MEGEYIYMYKIKIYQDKNGNSEIKKYLEKLKNANTKESRIKFNKIIMYVTLLSKNGLNLGEPYIKKLTKEIWEIRPIRDRILFVNLYNNTIILLSVFMKKSNKTPIKEIEKAERLLEEYKKGVKIYE